MLTFEYRVCPDVRAHYNLCADRTENPVVLLVSADRTENISHGSYCCM
jgi:hypothetical protein